MKHPPLHTLPVLAICGYSGAGKTTLIESLLTWLTARGLRTMTVKHDLHGLDVDRKGKDSDRFFRAGSDVLLHGPGERLARLHTTTTDADLTGTILELLPRYDLILVEGHKFSPLPNKIWLRRNSRDSCPDGIPATLLDLKRDVNRPAIVKKFVESWLQDIWKQIPVRAGILIGGASRRMGRPKHLLPGKKKTWLEETVAKLRPLVDEVMILGQGEIPSGLHGLKVLPDLAGTAGPVAGMLAAMRHCPLSSWLFTACDQPLLDRHALRWLLSQRLPGRWAVLPSVRGSGLVEPLPAWYGYQARYLLETCSRPCDLAGHPAVATPTPPPAVTRAWTNINTPEDLRLSHY